MASAAYNVIFNVVGCPAVTVCSVASANIITEDLMDCFSIICQLICHQITRTANVALAFIPCHCYLSTKCTYPATILS